MSAIVDLAFTYPEFAVALKRAHDRDLPIWLLWIFFGAGAVLDLLTVLGVAGTNETPSMLSLAIVVPFGVFGLALLVELGFRRGTVGPNQIRARSADHALTGPSFDAETVARRCPVAFPVAP